MPHHPFTDAFFAGAKEEGGKKAETLGTMRKIKSWAKTQWREQRFKYGGAAVGKIDPSYAMKAVGTKMATALVGKLLAIVPGAGSTLEAIWEAAAPEVEKKAFDKLQKDREEELSAHRESTKITMENFAELQSESSSIIRCKARDMPDNLQKLIVAIDKLIIVHQDLSTKMRDFDSKPNCEALYKMIVKWQYLKYRIRRARMYAQAVGGFVAEIQSQIDSYEAEDISFEMDLLDLMDDYFNKVPEQAHMKNCKDKKDHCPYH